MLAARVIREDLGRVVVSARAHADRHGGEIEHAQELYFLVEPRLHLSGHPDRPRILYEDAELPAKTDVIFGRTPVRLPHFQQTRVGIELLARFLIDNAI